MNLSAKKLKKLGSREYRESLLREIVIGWVVNQIKSLRRQRGWTQERLAEEASKPQSVIARIESESYGNWNTNTLLDIASAFDVALQIRFVSWPQFLAEADDTSPKAMQVPSFSRDQFLVKPLYRNQLTDLRGVAQPQQASLNEFYATPRSASQNLPLLQDGLH